MRIFSDFIGEESKQFPILFIGFSYDVEELSGDIVNLKELIQRKIPQAQFGLFSDISISNDSVFIFDEYNLDSFSKIFIGPIGDNEILYSVVLDYCKIKKIPVISYGASSENCNKLLQTIRLCNSQVPMPKTFIGKSSNIEASSIAKCFDDKFPIVSKIIDGSQGKGVELHDNMESLEEICNSKISKFLIFQEFIPNDCDYRVFFIGSEYIACIKRTRKDSNEFRNNVSLGGKAERFVLHNDQLVLARKAHEAMGFYASGVDLIQDKKTKKWFILEVNSAPQFAAFGTEGIIDIFLKQMNAL